MEHNKELINQPSPSSKSRALISSSMGNHQLIIITQLLKIAENMHHFDELLLWLSRVIVQRFNIEALQFWALQTTSSGQFSTELRTMATQSDTLPQHVVVNTQIAETVEQILQEQRGVIPRPVHTLFSASQTRLLYQYNLNYWASYFLSNSALLPPTAANEANGKIATPLTMSASLFIRQAPGQRLLPTIGNILEQAISIAKHRGLLLTTRITNPLPESKTLAINPPPIDSTLDLASCIPRHTCIAENMRGRNPFTILVIIPDKQLRSLYNAIDGQKTVAELSTALNVDSKEFYAILRLLFVREYIQFYTHTGQLVESTKLLAAL